MIKGDTISALRAMRLMKKRLRQQHANTNRIKIARLLAKRQADRASKAQDI